MSTSERHLRIARNAGETFWEAAVVDLQAFESWREKIRKLDVTSDEGQKALGDLAFRKSQGTAPTFIGSAFHEWMNSALTMKDIDSDPDAARPRGTLILEVADGKKPLSDLIKAMDTYAAVISDVVRSSAPERFTYQGFHILNPEHLGDDMARQLLEGVDFLVALFKKRGLEHLLKDGVKDILLRVHRKDGDGNTHAYYATHEKRITLTTAIVNWGSKGRLFHTWVDEVFVHEFGHHVHLSYMSGEAREAWNDTWSEVKKKEGEFTEAVGGITRAERQRFFDLLESTKWSLPAAAKKVKGIDKIKFGIWLREPMVGEALITPKQFRLTSRGEDVFDFFRDPDAYIRKEFGPGSDTPDNDEYLKKQMEMRRRRRLDMLGLEWDGVHRISPATVEALVEENPELKKALEEAKDKLGIVSDYGRTNEREDFAEAFVAFMIAPEKLTPEAKFRMQRALSLSGLYGKHVMHLAREDQPLDA